MMDFIQDGLLSAFGIGFVVGGSLAGVVAMIRMAIALFKRIIS